MNLINIGRPPYRQDFVASSSSTTKHYLTTLIVETPCLIWIATYQMKNTLALLADHLGDLNLDTGISHRIFLRAALSAGFLDTFLSSTGVLFVFLIYDLLVHLWRFGFRAGTEHHGKDHGSASDSDVNHTSAQEDFNAATATFTLEQLELGKLKPFVGPEGEREGSV